MNLFASFFSHPFIVLFIVANLAIGSWAHWKAKVNIFEDYALASRKLPTGILVMTLLATRIGSGDLGEADQVFEFGMLRILMALSFMAFFLEEYLMIILFLGYFLSK